MKKSFYEERIRQAQLAFNALLVASVLMGIVNLTGLGSPSPNRVYERTAYSIGKLVSYAAFVKILKDANDRLDKVMKEEEDEQ